MEMSAQHQFGATDQRGSGPTGYNGSPRAGDPSATQRPPAPYASPTDYASSTDQLTIPDRRIAVGRPVPGVDQRIGDVERSEVCEQLSAHFAAGRLTEDDLEYRLTMAVHAVTRADLRRLTIDLPSATEPHPNPGPSNQPTRPAPQPRGWPALSVLAVLALLGSLTVAGGLLLLLGAYETWLFVGAFVGGSAAALGGASATYLIMQHLRVRRPGE